MADSSITVKVDLAKVEQVTADLRAAIQEAHGLLKDIKQAKRDIDEYVCPGIDNRLEAEVKKQLNLLNEATGKAIDSATEAVFKRFDKLTALLMGEEDSRPTVDELIQQKVELERGSKDKEAPSNPGDSLGKI